MKVNIEELKDCNKEYNNREDAMQCEASCQGLTLEEYQKYLSLLEEEKNKADVKSEKDEKR